MSALTKDYLVFEEIVKTLAFYDDRSKFQLDFLDPEKRIEEEKKNIRRSIVSRFGDSGTGFNNFITTTGIRLDVSTEEAFLAIVNALWKSTETMLKIFGLIKTQENKFFNQLIQNEIEKAIGFSERKLFNIFDDIRLKFMNEGLELSDGINKGFSISSSFGMKK